jgi:flagellar hook-basal body complex protein FliE
MMNEINAKHLLSQIQKYQASIGQTRLQPSIDETGSGIGSVSNFANTISKAVVKSLGQVNTTQKVANEMISKFETGEDIALTDVVLAMQKSSLEFEATLQVRNKILKAYEDIMNMPV